MNVKLKHTLQNTKFKTQNTENRIQMALASLVAISGPKNVSIFRAHPFQWLLAMEVARIKIITSRAI
jgi:hypothetical protein